MATQLGINAAAELFPRSLASAPTGDSLVPALRSAGQARASLRSALRGSGARVMDLEWSYTSKGTTVRSSFDLVVIHPLHGVVAGNVLDVDGRAVVIRSKKSPALSYVPGLGFTPLASAECPLQDVSVSARALAETLRPLFAALDPTRPRAFQPGRLDSDPGIGPRRDMESFFHPALVFSPEVVPGSYWPLPHPTNDWLPPTVLGLRDLAALLTAPNASLPALYPDEVEGIVYCLGAESTWDQSPGLAVAC